MNKLHTLATLWSKNKYQIIVALYDHLVHSGITNLLSDETFIKLSYRVRVREKLDLNHPKTFSQKIQWLKLHDRNPIYTKLVDKVLVKKYVAELFGEQYIIPTLGVWDRFDDIDFDLLPDQFVLKCNHDSGSIVICKDKANFDKESARRKLSNGLKTDPYQWGKEWPYKDVKRKILAEQYMESPTPSTFQISGQLSSGTHDLTDYKFFCFNGEPRYCQVIMNRSINETIDFFDMDWNHQEFTGLHNPSYPYPHSPNRIDKPKTFEIMKKQAKELSTGIPFVRVDFYEIEQQAYFGEMTFYPASGFGCFEPDCWNLILGDMISIKGINH